MKKRIVDDDIDGEQEYCWCVGVQCLMRSAHKYYRNPKENRLVHLPGRLRGFSYFFPSITRHQMYIYASLMHYTVGPKPMHMPHIAIRIFNGYTRNAQIKLNVNIQTTENLFLYVHEHARIEAARHSHSTKLSGEKKYVKSACKMAFSYKMKTNKRLRKIME